MAGRSRRSVALRSSVAAVVAAAVRLLQEGVGPASWPLEPSAALAFWAGLVGGAAGAAGFVAGEVGLALALHGRLPALLYLAAELLLGLVAFAAFRLVPKAGRTLHNVTSYQTLIAAALLGSLPAAALTVQAVWGRMSAPAVATWWAASSASILLLVPPLALAAMRLGEPLAAPIPGEWTRTREPPAPQPRWRSLCLAAGLAAGICVLLAALRPVAPVLLDWFFLFLFIPIFWAVAAAGSLGGILVGALSGLGYLLSSTAPFGSSETWHPLIVARQAAAVVFPGVGTVFGRARDRERQLVGRLERANARLRGELEAVVGALRSAVGAKDAYTEGHMRRVATYAVATGRSLGMSPRELELLEAAAMLHDVGKIGVPESILHKPGPLEPLEQEIVARHPEIGARICEDLEGLREAATLVRHHQERFDGRQDVDRPGYPDGLAGERIPLGARIIAVVDAFDAMTSDRAYRPALGIEQAVVELRRGSGGQFDPQVVESFARLLGERPWF